MTPTRTIIYLHRCDPPDASWVTFNSDHSIYESVTHSTLDQLSGAAKQTQTTLIVPAEDVVLTTATLPKLNRTRLMQALPYALEEQLIDEVDDLHFAIADYQADGSLPVAVVAKNKMTTWLELCKQYEIRPTMLISSVFSLPYEELKWYVSIDNDNCVARTGKYSGFACDKTNLQTLLDLDLSPDTHVETLHFSSAQCSEQYPLINLLQGEYQTKRTTSEIKKIWLYAGYATIAWLGFTFFSHLISLLLLHHEASGLETQIDAIYRRNFPDSSAIVAPRERMESKLKRIENESNRNNFIALLAYVGKGLSQTSVHLQNLNFRDQILTLELTAASFDELDALAKALTKQGLTVKQQSATVAGTQVKASMLIQRGTQ